MSYNVGDEFTLKSEDGKSGTVIIRRIDSNMMFPDDAMLEFTSGDVFIEHKIYKPLFPFPVNFLDELKKHGYLTPLEK